MRSYLESVLSRWEYPAKDRAELLSAYDAVGASAEFTSLLAEYRSPSDFPFDEMREGAGKIADKAGLHPFTLELLMFLCMCRKTEEFYRERGISQEIFDATALDLRYKLEECREVYRICGTFVGPWFYGFFALRRFALGRLQFELDRIKKEIKVGEQTVPGGTDALAVHIPRDGNPLSPEKCDEAFALAAEFFPKYFDCFSAKYTVFTCGSWLLYPENERILPEKSNVRSFMKRFAILSSYDHGPDNPDLWRLFDRPYTGDPGVLPCDSSLRRAYVKHLKNGGKTGEGWGVFVLGTV